MPVSEIIQRTVVNVLKEHGCSLYHLERKGNRLEIFVDKKGGATIGDCAKISRALSLDLVSLKEEWRNLNLDVSTPGIERKLYTTAHYRSAVGERVCIKVGDETIEGRMLKAGDDGVLIESETGEGRRIGYNEILSARVHRTTEELFKRR